MGDLADFKRNLVIANRILAREEVVDYLGHISVRHPTRPDRFLLSRSRSPALVTLDDIKEYDLDCNPIETGHPMYGERPIHGAIYAARPDVMAVAHNHAYEVVPFTVNYDARLRALVQPAYRIGLEAPIWDPRPKFGDTSMLVLNMEQGRDLASMLAGNSVVLMRNHGCAVATNTLINTVYAAIYLKVNARLQGEAMRLGERMSYLTAGELQKIEQMYRDYPVSTERAWEHWQSRIDLTDL